METHAHLRAFCYIEVNALNEKTFKTINEQIALLQSRGLLIKDDLQTRDFLLKNNYYRISGYSLTLRNRDAFYKGTTLTNIMDIYCFDHELRHLLLQYLETIEVTIKSIYAYEFCQRYGALGYLDQMNFTDKVQYNKIIEKTKRQCDSRHAHEAYIKHFLDDLQQDIPLWAYVDLLTISDISFLYSISKDVLRETIAHHFDLSMNKGPAILGNFLHSMTIIRNLCAHGSRLFNRLFERKPSLNKKEQALLIKNADGTMNNAHLYGFILIIRRLLPDTSFAKMKMDIITLTEKYPFVNMKHYGFREDWQEKL